MTRLTYRSSLVYPAVSGKPVLYQKDEHFMQQMRPVRFSMH